MKPWCGVARLGSIGDNLIASSVLPLLARDYHVEVICQRPHHVIFENNPYIGKLTPLDEDHCPPGCGIEWQQWWATRAKEYAKFVHLSHSIEVSLAALPAQTQFYWPASMRRRMYGHNYLEFTHDVAEVPYEFAPAFYPTQEESIWVDERLRDISGGKPVIGWVVAGSRLDKIYPPSPMEAGRLIKETGAMVLLFGGGAKDLEAVKVIEDQVLAQNGSHDGLRAAISQANEDPPRWPLRRSLAALQRCDVVIGPDTGLMWSVAMRPMPKIMLLSHASPENITKHWRNTVTLHADQGRVPCHPCHQLHDEMKTCTPNKLKNGAACISDINPSTIIEEARRALQGPHMRLVA